MDGDRHAQPGHSFKCVGGDSRFGPLIGLMPGMKTPADNGLVAIHRRLHEAPPAISGTTLPSDVAVVLGAVPTSRGAGDHPASVDRCSKRGRHDAARRSSSFGSRQGAARMAREEEMHPRTAAALQRKEGTRFPAAAPALMKTMMSTWRDWLRRARARNRRRIRHNGSRRAITQAAWS
jgi:hypothetical protein